MGKFIISEQEKNRILKMHQSTKMKPYLFEDDVTTVTTTIKDLPEVTISAWLPPKSASEKAKEKNGDILIYFYNENCSYCEGFTQKLMSDTKFRTFIKDNNLTISKQKACGDYEGWGCNEEENDEWKFFANQYMKTKVSWSEEEQDEKVRDIIRNLPAIALTNNDFTKLYTKAVGVEIPEKFPYEQFKNSLGV